MRKHTLLYSVLQGMFYVILFTPSWGSPLLVQSLHIVHPHAEDEEVLLSSFLCHFNIGSIHGADGEGSVQHELHVPGARSLSTCCGDLLREIRGRDDCRQETGRKIQNSSFSYMRTRSWLADSKLLLFFSNIFIIFCNLTYIATDSKF